MRSFPTSATYTFPEESVATPPRPSFELGRNQVSPLSKTLHNESNQKFSVLARFENLKHNI